MLSNTGAPGEVGLPGPVGVYGEPGLMGENGLAGEEGMHGRAGRNGERGNPGDLGPWGPVGVPGPIYNPYIRMLEPHQLLQAPPGTNCSVKNCTNDFPEFMPAMPSKSYMPVFAHPPPGAQVIPAQAGYGKSAYIFAPEAPFSHVTPDIVGVTTQAPEDEDYNHMNYSVYNGDSENEPVSTEHEYGNITNTTADFEETSKEETDDTDGKDSSVDSSDVGISESSDDTDEVKEEEEHVDYNEQYSTAGSTATYPYVDYYYGATVPEVV